MGKEQARLADLLAALTLAMDIGLGLPIEWVLRCTLTGVRLVDAMGLDDSVAADVYYLSLLRHIGCTSMASEFAHFFGTDLLGPEVVFSDTRSLTEGISFLASVGTGESLPRRVGAIVRAMRAPSIETVDTVQCDAACRLAAGIGIEERLIDCLRQSRERWDGKGAPVGLKGEEIDLAVRVTHVAQDLVLCGLLFSPEEGRQELHKRAGHLLDPEIVAFISEVEMPPEDVAVWDEVMAIEPKPPRRVDVTEHVLGAFADFADLKSTYLLGHSRRVAALAREAGEHMGLVDEEIEDLQMAGLVHDLGRVGVSSAIWDKPGQLTAIETEQVRLHPYFTERILSRSSSLGDLVDIACSHHENADGSGYHRRVKDASLSMAARVLAAADTYSALCEPRPHRPPFDPEDAAAVVKTEVSTGHLDDYAAQAVLEVTEAAPPRSGRSDRLTARELEVMRLAARGLTIREMADELVISRKTADRHVQNVYTKLGISNRAAAAIWAMEHGLI